VPQNRYPVVEVVLKSPESVTLHRLQLLNDVIPVYSRATILSATLDVDEREFPESSFVGDAGKTIEALANIYCNGRNDNAPNRHRGIK
jgi:hypothetical protein